MPPKNRKKAARAFTQASMAAVFKKAHGDSNIFPFITPVKNRAMHCFLIKK
jgi:hypothetical protein